MDLHRQQRVQRAERGDKVSESFEVTSIDGTKSSVTVTITGSNDAAVVSSANVTLTETDAPLVTGGTLTATDVDNPDNTFTRSPWWASTASSPWRRTASGPSPPTARSTS
ncbi:hypothetical protein MC69_000045 [Aeromonas hydrophila]|nr:VCBS domain-containing protein [Aeromonas hydrophila]PNO64248.1 hypothetical protein MC69_000045 [Aeromonas hydrophila]